jgi:hypothetical protein
MEKLPFSEALIISDSQQIRRSLWNPKFQYRIHKILPILPIMNKVNPVHEKSNDLRYVLKHSYLNLGFPSGLFPFGFPHKPCTDLRRLATGIRSEKCVVRRFRRCANFREWTYTNLDSTMDERKTNLMQLYIYIYFNWWRCSTCFGRIRPSSGALEN